MRSAFSRRRCRALVSSEASIISDTNPVFASTLDCFGPALLYRCTVVVSNTNSSGCEAGEEAANADLIISEGMQRNKPGERGGSD